MKGSVFFVKKVENGGFWKKRKNGGVFFVKKWTFPQRKGALCTVSVFFLFYILLICGGAYGPVLVLHIG